MEGDGVTEGQGFVHVFVASEAPVGMHEKGTRYLELQSVKRWSQQNASIAIKLYEGAETKATVVDYPSLDRLTLFHEQAEPLITDRSFLQILDTMNDGGFKLKRTVSGQYCVCELGTTLERFEVHLVTLTTGATTKACLAVTGTAAQADELAAALGQFTGIKLIRTHEAPWSVDSLVLRELMVAIVRRHLV